MSDNKEIKLGILEYNEGAAKDGCCYWHYNWGGNTPNTNGWASVALYNYADRRVERKICAFCDMVDKMQPTRTQLRKGKVTPLSLKKVKVLAKSFFEVIDAELAKQIKVV